MPVINVDLGHSTGGYVCQSARVSAIDYHRIIGQGRARRHSAGSRSDPATFDFVRQLCWPRYYRGVPTCSMLDSMSTLLLDKRTSERTEARRGASGPRLAGQIERRYFSVCIAHRKGGVGKTTTAWYVGRELARAGKNVILRDLDPQRGLSDIVRDLGGEHGIFSRRLALVVDEQPLPFHPDVELIDTPPALDESLPGLNRADAVIVPAVPEHQAVRALERMLQVLEDSRRDHPFLMPMGILPVRVRRRWQLHQEFLASIDVLAAEFGYPVLPAIPESQDVLRYSLRGRYWRPVAERIMTAISKHERATVGR
jgi:cellulose biosynthesis protein BcsQ